MPPSVYSPRWTKPDEPEEHVCDMPNCDKITPGMVMGALRVNVPTVFVTGGPMKAGTLDDGTSIDLATVFEGVGQLEAGEITEEKLTQLECAACPSGGSCSGMFTANSMNTLMEAMGIALPGNGTILALQDPPLGHALHSISVSSSSVISPASNFPTASNAVAKSIALPSFV